MAAIDHVTLRVDELDSGLELYTQVFELLPFGGARFDGEGFHEWDDFSIARSDAEHPETRGVHIGFAAESREQIDGWWQALTAAGYESDGEPGLRPEYGADYYGGFIRDRAGNSIEAVHHGSTDPGRGNIDHLWIRVHDLPASKQFYAGIAPAVGLRSRDLGDRLQLVADGGTVSFVAGAPTENLHLAFGVHTAEHVIDFHGFGLHAGGRDNGPPGERPEYHPGYYGAYLLDPDSNNIEAVFHDRTNA